jgi:Polyketide cyclase / dehydrase and lipid transport
MRRSSSGYWTSGCAPSERGSAPKLPVVTDLDFADSIFVSRDPDVLYAMVSDVTRMGEWSPVCRACWWDEGAGPHVGAWFTGRNETEARTWETRSQVVAAVPGREFAWEVNDGRVRWGFEFDAEHGGTRLTESWKFLPAGIDWFHQRFQAQAEAEIAARSEAAKHGIPTTLAALKAAAETS